MPFGDEDDVDEIEIPVVDDDELDDEDEEDPLAAGFTEVTEDGIKIPDPIEEDEEV